MVDLLRHPRSLSGQGRAVPAHPPLGSQSNPDRQGPRRQLGWSIRPSEMGPRGARRCARRSARKEPSTRPCACFGRAALCRAWASIRAISSSPPMPFQPDWATTRVTAGSKLQSFPSRKSVARVLRWVKIIKLDRVGRWTVYDPVNMFRHRTISYVFFCNC
jgi:hypothetical protein